MLQDNKNLNTAVPRDLAELEAQLIALREDMAKLAGSVSSIAEQRGRRMATDISEGFGEAARYVGRKGQSAEAELERAVATHPLMSLALAAGAGLMIGILTRR